jgi:hypothetical protein
MNVQTDYGEQPLDEVIRCYHLWKAMIARSTEIKHQINQTDEGKVQNRMRAKAYYERHKDEIIAKRKAAYEAKKNSPQFLDT